MRYVHASVRTACTRDSHAGADDCQRAARSDLPSEVLAGPVREPLAELSATAKVGRLPSLS